jgi:hypothetical protein
MSNAGGNYPLQIMTLFPRDFRFFKKYFQEKLLAQNKPNILKKFGFPKFWRTQNKSENSKVTG